MSYATKQDMIDRYGELELIQLTDRATPSTNAIVDSVLNQALSDAAAVADGYIARRYDLPIAQTPPLLVMHSAALSYYELHRGRYPDEVRAARDDAYKFLKDVSEGKILLDVGGNEPKSSIADARVEAPTRIFNRDNLRGF